MRRINELHPDFAGARQKKRKRSLPMLIFNTNQGGQFTSMAFTGMLRENGIAISIDGRGSWHDNVFVERLWRWIKYEEVYLRAYETVSDARESIGRYLAFYNGRRPHSIPDRKTPTQPTSMR
jgi:putative transposase